MSLCSCIVFDKKQHGHDNRRGGHQINHTTERDGVTNVFELRRLAAVLRGETDKQRSERATAPTNRIHQAGRAATCAWLDGIVERSEDAGVIKSTADTKAGHGN